MLCDSCLSIFNCNRVQEGKILQTGFHIIRLHGIRQSGRAGCALCAQLYHKLKCSIVPANEPGEDFWLTQYHLHYRIIEYGGSSDRFNLSFRLSAPEGPARDTIICTHEFQIASFDSNYTPLMWLSSVKF